MLSKNNKILIGCLALLLVMSVGYALFSDTITINGSATAKGDFKLTTTCMIAPKEAMAGAAGVNLQTFGTSKSEISCENNNVTISTNLDQPGAYAWYKIIVKNEGSIKARLKSLEIVEKDFVMDETNAGYADFVEYPIMVNLFPARDGEEIFEDYYAPDYTYEGWFDEYDFTDRLPSGYTFEYYVLVRWIEDDTIQRPEGITSNYTIDFNFEQATE